MNLFCLRMTLNVDATKMSEDNSTKIEILV